MVTIKRHLKSPAEATCTSSSALSNRATHSSRSRIIAYWVTTGLIAFQLGSGGAGDILRIEPVVEGMAHLGYPAYFCLILGVWKVLGAAAVLAPGFSRLKEWAYAGTVFDLTGAPASHLAVGDGAIKLVAPIIFTCCAFASWALRPSTRRLGDAFSQPSELGYLYALRKQLQERLH